MWKKFLSRKFLMAVGGIIITLAAGFGYNLDAELVAKIAGGIAATYILIEGIADAMPGNNRPPEK